MVIFFIYYEYFFIKSVFLGKKNYPLLNEEKIEKIISVDDLVSTNCIEKLSKEGILIDFENEVNHVSSTINDNTQNNKIDSITNPLNDLADIKFNTQEILNLYKQSDLKNNLPEKNDNDNDLITTATSTAAAIPCGSSTTFSASINTNATEKFQDEEEEIPSNSFNSSGKSYYSKYYMPPYDNQSTSQYGKNRYYSSVCSNCDTMKNQYNTMVNENGPSCQCCYDLGYGSHAHSGHFVSDFVSTCFDNHNFFNDVCTTNYLHNDHTEKRFAPPIPYSTSTLSNVSTKTNINANTNSNNNHETKRNNFQTKICKDFIDELEANFSKIGQVRMNELSNDTNHNNNTNNSNSPIFPTINPPPKSYKTRRPAPPPPIQKKNV